ncbi:MAG TPA: hypothetical protein VJT13_04320 [Xanthobacteraceae bacterium]|nr:hypothetical protein [Xanthobacteraceae bacterium]
MKDEPRFRRRPPSSTRAGDAIQTNIALIGFRPRRPLRRALGIKRRSRRCSEEKDYLPFFFFAFLAFFAFFAFFAMLPSKQLVSWRCRNDAHPIRRASRCNLYSSKQETPNPVNKK